MRIVFCPMSIVPPERFTLNLVAEKRMSMKQAERKIQSEERRHKSAEAQQFSEDRAQLLDTIREMIDIEFERRGVKPEGTGREPPGCKPPRLTLWQRLMSLFNTILNS